MGKTAQSMLEKYGGAEHLKKLPQELLAGQSEDYVGALTISGYTALR